MIDWLQNEWMDLTSIYTDDSQLILRYWIEIKSHYTSKNRHYHNLYHIHNMLGQAKDIKSSIDDYDALRFAIWYHDIIYKATKKNNEEKSAKFAENRLKSTRFDAERITMVYHLIASTKHHDVVLNETNDNAYLLDLDLSILGAKWDTYQSYIQNIRKEYAIYPDFMYKKGRKKVLKHFLERNPIYFTNSYRAQFEDQARQNIKKEINAL